MVNLNISANICENIKHYENYTNQVQEEVSKLQIVGNFFHIVPEIIVGLLIGRYLKRNRILGLLYRKAIVESGDAFGILSIHTYFFKKSLLEIA